MMRPVTAGDNGVKDHGMKLIVALVLVAGLALGGLAIRMAQSQIGQYQSDRDALLERVKQMPRLVDIVVAKHDLKYGQRFDKSDLVVTQMQADHIPAGAFSLISAPDKSADSKRAVFADTENRPRAAMRAYLANEPILASKITQPGMDAGIAAILAPNMRAFTMTVDVQSSISGFLRPGSTVDVYWSGTINNTLVSKLIYPNLRLIAVDQSVDSDRPEITVAARTITAEVSPEDVAALTLAQSSGNLTLALVGSGDTTDVGAIEVNRDQALGITPEAIAPQQKTCTIRTRKGTDVVETQIPCPQQ